MQLAVSRRAVAAVTALVLLAGVYALARPADAQGTTEVVFVTSLEVDPNASGFVFLDGAGSNQGVVALACTGNSPIGGTPQIPSQVVSQVRADDAVLRVLRPQGTAVAVPVVVNCAVDLIFEEAAGVSKARAAFTKRVAAK